MQKKIIHLLLSVFALTCLWGIFVLSRFILEERPTDNLKHIPGDATYVLRINGSRLISEGFSSIVLEEDKEVLRLLKELVDRRQDETGERALLGIDFNSDIVVFDKELGHEHLFGMIFNLNNPNLFRKNIKTVLQPGQVASFRDRLGIILLNDNSDSNTMSVSDLRIQADQILKQESDFNALEKLAYTKENTIARSWSGNGLVHSGEIFTSSDLSFDLYDHRININGTVKIELHDHDMLTKRLAPKGIHFTAKTLSGEMKDTLELLFRRLDLPTGQLCGLSMNFYGTKMIEEPSLMLIPLADALFKFESTYQIRPTLDSLHSAGEITLDKDQFEFGGKIFYWTQIDHKTIYIGLTERPEIIDFTGDEIMTFSGDIALLTNIEGTGNFRKLLELLPKYSASKILGNKIHNCDFKVIRTGKNEFSLNGMIDFDQDEFAINAVLSFMLESRFLN